MTYHPHHDLLQWIDEQQQPMLDQVIEWSNINTYTFNLLGLKILSKKISKALTILGEEVYEIELPSFCYVDNSGNHRELPLAPLLMIQKRPHASRQCLLVIHMDTAYPPQESLQEAFLIEGRILHGQGVSDAKGGIVVLVKSLEAFEKSDVSDRMGWKIIITTDREIGSPCSKKILTEIAKQYDLGFIFEPCLPDGGLIGSRKGAGYFAIVARAQNTSNSIECRTMPNAIDAIAGCVSRIHAINGTREGLSINLGLIYGGKTIDQVPDSAVIRFEIKLSNSQDIPFVEDQINMVVRETAKEKNLSLSLWGGFSLPPKPLNEATLRLLHHIQKCGEELNLHLDWRDSNRVCDGNILNAVGLPTVDTLGVQGGKIHSPEEYMYIESLKERTKLTTLALLKWAEGSWDI